MKRTLVGMGHSKTEECSLKAGFKFVKLPKCMFWAVVFKETLLGATKIFLLVGQLISFFQRHNSFLSFSGTTHFFLSFSATSTFFNGATQIIICRKLRLPHID